MGSFRNRISLTAPGSERELTDIRDGSSETLKVTIGQFDEKEQLAEASSATVDQIDLTVRSITPQLAEHFNIQAGQGVVVTQVRPGSIAAMGGIQPGTLIMQVNRQPVKTANDFKRVLGKSRRDKRVLLLVRKGDVQQYLVLSW